MELTSGFGVADTAFLGVVSGAFAVLDFGFTGVLVTLAELPVLLLLRLALLTGLTTIRSEERRVGKECRL